MSDATSRHAGRGRGAHVLHAVLSAALYTALVIAGFGFVSLLTDTDVVPDPSAGTATGPVMVAASSLVVLAGVLLCTQVRPRPPGLRMVLFGLLAVVAYSGAGALIRLGSTGDTAAAVAFLVARMIIPYAAVVGVAALVVMVGAWYVRPHRAI